MLFRSEIYLSGTPATANETYANAMKIIEQLRQGASFAAYARQFSEASTAAVGGVTSLTGAVLIGEGRYQTRYHEQRAAAASRPPSQVAATGDRRVALMPYLLSPVGAGVTTSGTW